MIPQYAYQKNLRIDVPQNLASKLIPKNKVQIGAESAKFSTYDFWLCSDQVSVFGHDCIPASGRGCMDFPFIMVW